MGGGLLRGTLFAPIHLHARLSVQHSVETDKIEIKVKTGENKIQRCYAQLCIIIACIIELSAQISARELNATGLSGCAPCPQSNPHSAPLSSFPIVHGLILARLRLFTSLSGQMLVYRGSTMNAFIPSPHALSRLPCATLCLSRSHPSHRTTSSRNQPCMVAKPENEPDANISSTVERLYDTYPFPPETLLDEAPIGYNWRWHYPSAYAFCTARLPQVLDRPLRILDAGCGTGESTSYLVYLNDGAHVTAIDLSNGALDVARERMERSLPDKMHRCDFIHKSIFDVADLDGDFDHINCVGVIHHTPDPEKALRALASKLKPGGIMHIFVYAAHGRWEISLMQKALRILQGNKQHFEEGVKLGRQVFAALPDGNRLKVRENNRWAQENKKDATFADMYLHPQEVDYDIPSLFKLIESSGLQFVAFSNPRTWDLTRLLANDESLLKKAMALPERDQYRLVELLDPESVTHFEFFLTKPPLIPTDWSNDDLLRHASACLSECITGWPSTVLMDRDYFPVMLSEEEYGFASQIVESDSISVGEAADKANLSLDGVREMIRKGVILLSPR